MVAKPSMLAAGGIARNGGRTEGIDGGLNEYVGDGEHAALQTGGDADAQNQTKGAALDARFFRLEADIAVAGDQAGEDKRRADELADDGRDGDARDAELQPGDEQHVEDDIDHAADGQIIQRALGIADGAKDSRAIVIDEAGGQADGVNIEIELRADQHVFGAAISSSSGAERSSSSAPSSTPERTASAMEVCTAQRTPFRSPAPVARATATDAPTLRPISMLTRR